MKIKQLTESKKRGSLIVDPVTRIMDSLVKRGILGLEHDVGGTNDEWYYVNDEYLLIFQDVQIYVVIKHVDENKWTLANPNEKVETHEILTRENLKELRLFKAETLDPDIHR